MPSARRSRYTAEGSSLAGQSAAAHRCLRVPRQGRARPDPARAARHRASRVLLRGDAEQRLRDEVLTQRALRGPRRHARQGDRRRPRRRRPRQGAGGIDVVIHCAASRLLRAAARRGARAQRQGPDPAAARAPPSRQRPVLRPRLHRLRRGSAHRARARAPVRHRADASPGSTSTPSSTRRAPGAATSRPSRASRSTSTASSRRPSARSAPPAARRPARAPRAAATSGSATQLTERGRERARALGWSDTYTLSKAIGERTLLAADPRRAHDRPPGDRRVRPAHALPRAGWSR